MHSIELKFGMRIIGNCRTYYIDFGNFKVIIIFFYLQEYKKECLYNSVYGVKL